MPLQMKRMYLDFVVRNYSSTYPEVGIVSGNHSSSDGLNSAGCVPWQKDRAFTLRCYMSLQGEDSPMATTPGNNSTKTQNKAPEALIYRYDWAFGITLIEGCYWDWMNELPEEGALAIHLVLKPDPFDSAPEAIPVGAVLSTLHPSRNTKGFAEQYLPAVLKGASGMAKIGAKGLPPLNYLSSGLTMGSNILESYTDNQKNWFLYQFLDEYEKAPVVEWRISKTVLREYGPLIRGTLFLAFQRPAVSIEGSVQITLRPQIRYCQSDGICYIIPTNSLKQEDRVSIQVRPKEEKKPEA
jgi:hypothetical protein